MTKQSNSKTVSSKGEAVFSKPISTRHSLARPGDPLVKADGKVVPDRKRAPVDTSRVVDPISFRPMKKRTMRELPGGVGQINGAAAVFTYTMLGVSDREICDALKIDMEQLATIKTHPVYSDIFETVHNEFINTNSEIIQSRIAAMAHDALDSISNIAVHGKQEKNVLLASQDLLERGGISVKNFEQKKNVALTGLKILVTEEKGTVEVTIHGTD